MDRQDILASLASRQTYPAAAISYCRHHRERTVAIFLPLLQRAASGTKIEPLEEQAMYLGLHILGSFAMREVFSPLLTLATEQEHTFVRLLGSESIATSFSRLLMCVCSGQGEALWTAVRRNELDFLIRDACLRAWTFEVFEGRVGTVQAENQLRDFLRADDAPAADDLIWNGWLSAIADLGLTDLLPLAQDAMSGRRILAEWENTENSDFQSFRTALEEAEAAEDRAAFQAERGYVRFGPGSRDWGEVFLNAPPPAGSGVSTV